jgi:hypothetical protein
VLTSIRVAPDSVSGNRVSIGVCCDIYHLATVEIRFVIGGASIVIRTAINRCCIRSRWKRVQCRAQWWWCRWIAVGWSVLNYGRRRRLRLRRRRHHRANRHSTDRAKRGGAKHLASIRTSTVGAAVTIRIATVVIGVSNIVIDGGQGIVVHSFFSRFLIMLERIGLVVVCLLLGLLIRIIGIVIRALI